MVDPRNAARFVTGHAVLEAAADHIALRGEARDKQLPPQMKAAMEGRCRRLLREARAEVRQNPEKRLRFAEHEYRAAVAHINPRKQCAGIPYAAVAEMPPGTEELERVGQDLGRNYLHVPRVLKRQPVHCHHKPGRPRQLQSSYRDIAQSKAQLRITEELWAGRSEEMVMDAVGPTQFCRGDSLFVVFLEIEAGLIRAEQGLPDVTAYTDLAEAHDTAWPEQTTVALHDIGQIRGEELVMAHEMRHGTEVAVIARDDRSRWVALTGMPEGRRNASTLFAILASIFPRALADKYVGCGLDPPDHAITAYHMTKDGSTDQRPDVAWCRKVSNEALLGTKSWGEAMTAAVSDSNRLCLLDCASSVEVGLLQFSDDNKVKASSDGMLDVAVECLDNAVHKIRGQQLFGPGKGEFMVRQLPDQAPRGESKQCAVHKGLGAPIDAGLRLTPLLQQVESRAAHSWRALLCAADGLGLPPEVLISALRERVEPKSTYAAIFLVIRQDWQKRLDAMQDKWIMSLLGLQRKVARTALLREVGISNRLSNRVLGQAFGFLARIKLLSREHLATKVANLAGQHTITWTRTIVDLMQSMGVPDIQEWRSATKAGPPGTPRDKKERKAIAREYMVKAVHPALGKHEDEWRSQQKLRPSAAIVLADVVEDWWPLAAVRSWAQLRLQGFISMPAGNNTSSCPLCTRDGLPDLRHLFLECPETQSIIAGAVGGTSWEALPRAAQMHRLCTATTAPEARIAAGVAFALGRKLCQKAVGEDDSDTSAEEEF